MLTMVRVAILGAGASGLTSIKCCLDEGLEPVCFEKTDDIGGLWLYRGENNKFPELGCVFKSTVINTSKEMMSFSDFPCPKEFPNYMHNRYVYQYFTLYAKKFGLKKYIQFNKSIASVKKSFDFETSGKWDLEIKDELSGKISSETVDAVLLCNGHHAKPYYPHFPGLDEFQGKKVHTHYYQTPEPYKDKRVVIIGIGNSGGDAAVELSRWASQVYLSTRRGVWVFNRIVDHGVPVDLALTTRMNSLVPLWLRNHLTTRKLNFNVNHKMYGLLPKHKPFSVHPMVNDDLPNRLANGTVILKPNIKHFTKNGVEFEDGTREEDINAVIVATGYKFGYPFLPESVIKVEQNKVSLYKYVFPPDLAKPTLAVIGLIQPLGAINPISELQSRWVAQIFSGKTKLPSKAHMHKDIASKKRAMEERYVASQRHTIQVDYVKFMDDVATEVGAKPNLLRMLFTDPRLYLKCVFGPCLPYQYRLEGPNKWYGARDAIMTAWDRVEAPLLTRRTKVSSHASRAFLPLILIGVLPAIYFRHCFV